MAQSSFYAFINSPMGYGLFQILSLDILPGQEDWENHKAWWDGNWEKLQTKLNKRGAFDEYHEFVAWRTQLFMNKYWDLVAKVSSKIISLDREFRFFQRTIKCDWKNFDKFERR